MFQSISADRLRPPSSLRLHPPSDAPLRHNRLEFFSGRAGPFRRGDPTDPRSVQEESIDDPEQNDGSNSATQSLTEEDAFKKVPAVSEGQTL